MLALIPASASSKDQDMQKKTWLGNIKQEFRIYLRGNALNILPLVILLIVTIFTVFGDSLIVTHDPIGMNLTERLRSPSREHYFGTDEFGRDIFSRVISGTKISIAAAGFVLVIASTVGFMIGVCAGLWGGALDEILMRITDLFMAFPSMILAIAIAATLGASLKNTLIALSVVFWPWYARLVRAQVLSLRERDYITAARSLGASTMRIIVWHLLPNLMPILITQITLDVGYVILSTAGLSFLGLGAQPPTPEWGAMIMSARQFMRESWWYTTFPGLALLLTVLSFNLLGDALRDYLDPKMRGS
jgi:peptide/nickel transport system permease protein